MAAIGIANNVIADRRRLERRLAALERLIGEAPDVLPPTFKQRRYLHTLAGSAGQTSPHRTLAGCAGQTFATPRTPAQASAEIRRLKAGRSAGFTFAELQAKQSAREVHSDVAIVQAWESQAAERRYLELAVMTTVATETITTVGGASDR